MLLESSDEFGTRVEQATIKCNVCGGTVVRDIGEFHCVDCEAIQNRTTVVEDGYDCYDNSGLIRLYGGYEEAYHEGEYQIGMGRFEGKLIPELHS